MTNKR